MEERSGIDEIGRWVLQELFGKHQGQAFDSADVCVPVTGQVHLLERLPACDDGRYPLLDPADRPGRREDTGSLYRLRSSRHPPLSLPFPPEKSREEAR